MKKSLLTLCLILSLLLCACTQQATPGIAAKAPVSTEQAAFGQASSAKSNPARPFAADLPQAGANESSTPVPKNQLGSFQPSEVDQFPSNYQLKSAPAETQPSEQKAVPVYPQQTKRNTAQDTGLQDSPQFVPKTVPQEPPKVSQPSSSTSSQDAAPAVPTSDTGKCTISILCSTAIGKSDAAPPSGRFLSTTAVTLSGGETVYDILYAVCKANDIPLGGNSGYIKSIGGLAERDCGGGSGWLYRVNGDSPNVSCGNYKIFDGDRIEWIYTCEMGNDL